MEYQNENFNGEYDFRSRYHRDWKMGANLHEYSELLYCKSGEVYAIVNGNKILLKEKQFIWIPPNYIHQYECEGSEVVCAVFSNDFIPLFFRAQEGRYFCVSALDSEETSVFLEGLYRLDKKDSCRISGYLNLICDKVLKNASFEAERHTDGILYQRVILYISEHYTDDIRLCDIARGFGYNEKYLSHALHELTGIHFRQLLNFYRIERAKKLLTEDKRNDVTEVAMKSGFGSINTFHRTFKESTGMTPNEYRRKRTK